jgi:hypothetical protein
MTARSTGLMMGIIGFVLGSIVTTQVVRGQAVNKIDGPFTHISLAVTDADKTGKAIAELFGQPAPTSRVLKYIPFPPSFGDKTMSGKVTSVTGNGLRIEIIQPMSDGPWKDHIDRHGEGVHHVGWTVNDYTQAVRFLESKGGKWTQGNPTVNFGYVDMSPANIPFSIEVVGASGARVPAQDPPAQ